MPRFMVHVRSEITAEHRFNRKSSITIGSARGNNIVLAGNEVSEQHCSITRTDSGYEIKDTNTITGTRRNGKNVTAAELLSGDIIGVGSHDITFLEDPDAGGEPVYFFLGIYGKFEGKKFIVRQGETYIGREKVTPKGIENDIVLSGDMTVSKGHARVTCRGAACEIMDVGSTGGVAVNGEKLGQLNERALRPGDEVGIGRSIFRFVKDGAEDYGIPRFHSIFLLKIRRPLIMTISGIAIAASVILMARGGGGILTARKTPARIALDLNRTWSPLENVVKTAPGEIPYDISSSVAVGDLNGDGRNDIVYMNSSGQLFAWDGKKGSQLWKPVELFTSGKSSPALYDMNNDDVLDIVLVTDNSMLYVIDGQTSGVIRKDVLGGTVAENSPAVADLNGDGKADVVVCSEEGMVHFVYSPGFESGAEKYTEFVESPVHASPAIIASERISPMAVVANNAGKVFVFDGKTRIKRTIDLNEGGKAHLIAAAPAVGDLTGDGIPEVVVQSNVPQYVSAIDVVKSSVLWTYFVEPVPPDGLKHTASPAIADIDGDRLNDVIIVSANGSVYGLKGKTGYQAGELLWKTDIPGSGRIISSPALYSLEKNGVANCIFGTEDGSIVVGKMHPKRKEMELLTSVKASNVPITSSPVIGDVNSDGKVEIVYTNIINSVEILSSNVATFRNYSSWPMFLGNAAHSGNTHPFENTSSYYVMSVAGILLMALLLGVRTLVARRKNSRRPRVYVI